MKNIALILFFLFTFTFVASAQNSKQTINAVLNTDIDQLSIEQKIIYINKSGTTLQNLVLHNWANSFKDRNTKLSKRMLENYNKSFYFSDSIDRGYTKINKVLVNSKSAEHKEYKGSSDILEILLKHGLKPYDSLTLTLNYTVKIPSNVFTGYGKNKENDYILKYWYLAPAVNENGLWKAYNNLDIDHMYMNVSDYDLTIKVPLTYHINSGLNSTKTNSNEHTVYQLKGKNKVDIQLNITQEKTYTTYRTKRITVVSNFQEKKLPEVIRKSVIQREIDFIETYLGRFPHDKILIDKETADKDKVYGHDIPKIISGFSDVFRWDIQFFKALTKKMVSEMIIVNKNEDYWLPEGIETYLLMQYCKQYYPEAKLFGNLAKIWGLRTFNIIKMDFNSKYPFLYQFSARKNLDQSLTTSIDSLSNFNRKTISSYKSGLGLRYLENFLEPELFKKCLYQYLKENMLKINSTEEFKNILISQTEKDLSWFFGDYLNSSKKIDYTLKKIKTNKDSILITIKNKRNITAPVALYGIKNKKILWKKWISNIDSIKTIAVQKGDFDKISLNYENLYPEFNLRNNWKNVTPKLFERPLQLKLIKDIDDPYYTQVFYEPSVGYNYYDGAILGIKFHNNAILDKPFQYKITPTYSFKSRNASGGFSFSYNHYPEDTPLYKLTFSISGSSFNYERDFKYNSLNPSATIYFNRKSLRTPGNKFLRLKYYIIDKEVAIGTEKSNEDKYQLLKLTYQYERPEIINDFRFSSSLEIASYFSKLSADFRYRKLTKSNRQFDFRWYSGVFLNNNTESDSNYFSYGLSKPQDYLFEYNLYGREVDAGFLYQQYIIAQGGFKTFFSKDSEKYANQWISTLNTSFNVWKWLEIYNDVGVLKNKKQPIFIGYESGIRFNFMHELFELYLPVYSNNGWEMNTNYLSKIRFTFVLQPLKIFNSARRGFL